MDLAAGRISETYIPLVLNGVLGIFHNRFSYLWNPASECLAVLISKHVGFVWNKLVRYFQHCQSIFQISQDELDKPSFKLPDKSAGMLKLIFAIILVLFEGFFLFFMQYMGMSNFLKFNSI